MPHQPTIELKVLDPRLEAWGLPAYQSDMAAAIDLRAAIDAALEIEAGSPAVLVPSGLALFIRDPFVAAMILPRSGLGHKQGLVLGNSTGLIDADYLGPILVSVWNRNAAGTPPIVIEPGDRIAQMMFVPVVRPRFEVVADFSTATTRGAGGFGSTGS
ncbi:dUTP diphosphatase [Kaistia granuli]|uniref:dUTP diphosphatase n=1 Tax=Kaistia granuli TaxID=363259 RepID=UPI00037A5C59|nr:dUTP diphosphatase [Kaistia granuli]